MHWSTWYIQLSFMGPTYAWRRPHPGQQKVLPLQHTPTSWWSKCLAKNAINVISSSPCTSLLFLNNRISGVESLAEPPCVHVSSSLPIRISPSPIPTMSSSLGSFPGRFIPFYNFLQKDMRLLSCLVPSGCRLPEERLSSERHKHVHAARAVAWIQHWPINIRGQVGSSF